MSAVPTVDELYASAQEFAHEAIAAHRDRKARPTAVNAGTALEHLAKACLVRRSPGLLAAVKQGDHLSLMRLLGFTDVKPPANSRRQPLRTIGMHDAVLRATMFVPHGASKDDLLTLYDLRDGVIHAAANSEVDSRVILAFVTVADALLADLEKARADFWEGHLDAVDALLSEAASQADREVQFALAAAKARVEELYGDLPEDIRGRVMDSREPRIIEEDQDLLQCPNCNRQGVATGLLSVEWDGAPEYPDIEGPPRYGGTVTMDASSFECPVCGLTLPSKQHLTQAGLELSWTVDGVDPHDVDPNGPGWDYEPSDDDYQAYRDQMREYEEEQERF